VVLEQGDTGDGGIGRDQLAEILVHSLLTGQDQCRPISTWLIRDRQGSERHL
jgi:hypothetical protein